jgi:hypothetical protein
MRVTFLPLETWNRHWVLQGSRLRCRLCGASQDLMDNCAFSHNLGCPFWGRTDQYPWSELAKILRQQVQAGLFDPQS